MTISPNGQSTRVKNQLIAQIDKSTRHLVYAFDRMDFLLDASSPDLDWDRLERYCSKLKRLEHKDKFHPMWTMELRVSQPDPEFPRVFMEEVGSRYTVQIKYVEAGCDLITKSPEKAQRLLSCLIEHLLLSRARRPILKSQSVYYWAGRTAVTNLVAYADRASKVHSPWVGRSCAHMELRIRGTSGLNRFGIYGLEDLLHFDHRSAWESATTFAFVPSKTAMGYVLRDGEDVADDTALRAAEKYMAECAAEGHLALHNAIVEKRQLRKTLQMIPHREIFGEER